MYVFPYYYNFNILHIDYVSIYLRSTFAKPQHICIGQTLFYYNGYKVMLSCDFEDKNFKPFLKCVKEDKYSIFTITAPDHTDKERIADVKLYKDYSLQGISYYRKSPMPNRLSTEYDFQGDYSLLTKFESFDTYYSLRPFKSLQDVGYIIYCIRKDIFLPLLKVSKIFNRLIAFVAAYYGKAWYTFYENDREFNTQVYNITRQEDVEDADVSIPYYYHTKNIEKFKQAWGDGNFTQYELRTSDACLPCDEIIAASKSHVMVIPKNIEQFKLYRYLPVKQQRYIILCALGFEDKDIEKGINFTNKVITSFRHVLTRRLSHRLYIRGYNTANNPVYNMLTKL